jgi:hypothetical protein
MQTLAWYLQRLSSMSGSEVAWRVRSLVRDRVDRVRISRGAFRSGLTSERYEGPAPEPAFRLCDVPPGIWATGGLSDRVVVWRQGLLSRADAILAHRLSFFNLEDQFLGDPIDWHRDHESGTAAPRDLSDTVDYRDFRVTGDAKVVWEPNRHHQLVVLARAYRATGDVRYAAGLANQLDSWIEANPFGFGMNWRSPLELAIRLINWVWAIDLIRESGFVAGPFRARVMHAVELLLWEIDRKYSRGSSANNHRIGEAAGVFIASSYFAEVPGAARLRERSRRILEEEIVAQTYEDGCNREQALGYHAFVLQFFLVAGVVARRSGRQLSSRYWDVLQSMMAFVAALAEGGGTPPMFGDADDGNVIDLGPGQATDCSWTLAAGAVVFARPDFKSASTTGTESVFWLLGPDGLAAFDAISTETDRTLESRAFPHSGYYLLQCGHVNRPDAVSVLFDCGELGFGAIAAHGHADALNLTVRAYGRDVLVDPGTYDYFSHPQWRSYFRGTTAHNTVTVDGQDQSTMRGPFLWGPRAAARCTAWEVSADAIVAAGEHDGYLRLSDPVRHRRTLHLSPGQRTLTIRDELVASGHHAVTLAFHFGELCVVRHAGGNLVEVELDGHGAHLELDSRLALQIVRGRDQPIGGWISRGYHRKTPTTTVFCTAAAQGGSTFVSRLVLDPPVTP